MESQFLYTICREGGENALKREMAKNHPSFRPSYSRPGFVTWKCGEGALTPSTKLNSVFARAYGLSVARAADLDECVKKLKEEITNRKGFGPHFRFQVSGTQAKEIRALLLEKIIKDSPNVFLEEEVALKDKEGVITVHLPNENEFWIGFHIHSKDRSRDPGGDPGFTLPEEAPSRSYLKMKEAIRFSRVSFRKNDFALEVGSSPGGMSYALLEAGLRVVGIDPSEMNQVILSHPSFRHIQKSIADTRLEEVGEGIQWLVVDLKLVPKIALDQTERIVRLTKRSLLGGFLTLKLGDPAWEDAIPGFIGRLKDMGFLGIRATQLPSNRSEFTLIGFTEKGLLRVSKD